MKPDKPMPCPVCGSSDIQILESRYEATPQGEPWKYVHCGQCGIRTDSFSPYDDRIKNMIDRWNRRDKRNAGAKGE